jgi:hypothetical protein
MKKKIQIPIGEAEQQWLSERLEKLVLERPANPCVALYGPGPADQKCKACSHMYPNHCSKVYWKCSLRRHTNGPGSDHKRNWPACAQFSPLA